VRVNRNTFPLIAQLGAAQGDALLEVRLALKGQIQQLIEKIWLHFETEGKGKQKACYAEILLRTGTRKRLVILVNRDTVTYETVCTDGEWEQQTWRIKVG
jgi:hypothetical protein